MIISTRHWVARPEPTQPNDPHADTAVATLAVMGLPAAILTRSGCVVAINGLLGAMPHLMRPAAPGRLIIADHAADGLFRRALENASAVPGVCSIPIAGTPERPPVVLYLAPTPAANDVLPNVGFLLIAAALGVAEGVPDTTLLHGLFDLAPAEARLAAALAAGQSLKQAAAGAEIMVSTARSYLEAIFRKTGTSQQSQLVALLKSTGPLGRPPATPATV